MTGPYIRPFRRYHLSFLRLCGKLYSLYVLCVFVISQLSSRTGGLALIVPAPCHWLLFTSFLFTFLMIAFDVQEDRLALDSATFPDDSIELACLLTFTCC